MKEVRLVEGEFDQRELKSLQANSVKYIELMDGRKKTEFTIMLRILNGYFEKQWSGPSSGSKGKPLRSVFQNSKGFKSAQTAVVAVIEDTYGVKIS